MNNFQQWTTTVHFGYNSSMTYTFDHKKLTAWFLQNKRDLPWRDQPSPYAVWVSEVMLQQTQVAVVIPYFERWMRRFPTIADLAAAPLDDVIKLWEGLGYYSRARNLHEGAKYVVECHQGVLPNTVDALEKIKGLGAYTVGAILSFAFRQPIPAVDGNVLRVLARYYALYDDIAKGKTQRQFREIAQQILPVNEPWILTEALIELGATVCQKRAKCTQCPLKTTCKAFAQGIQEELPMKTRNQRSEVLYRAVAILQSADQLLIRKVQTGEIMSGLHEFPYFETGPEGVSDLSLKKQIKQQLGITAAPQTPLPKVSHSFTRYQVHLFPVIFECDTAHPVEGYQWMEFDVLDSLALSSGHRRVLNHFKEVRSQNSESRRKHM